jgi:hypothetical protein
LLRRLKAREQLIVAQLKDCLARREQVDKVYAQLDAKQVELIGPEVWPRGMQKIQKWGITDEEEFVMHCLVHGLNVAIHS